MPYAGERITAAWATALNQWDLYTPTLTAATTNPTLGSGATQTGWWHRTGNMIVGGARIRFGTGMSSGSGIYYVSLPFTIDTSYLNGSDGYGLGSVIGAGALRDDSNLSLSPTVSVIVSQYNNRVWLHTAANGAVNNAGPFAWTTNDAISISFAYLATGLP